MNLVLDESLPLPLRHDEGGTIRVAQTRVTLDSLVASFRAGCTPEETIQQYPALELADIYLVFGFYLRQRDQVEAYLAPRRAQAETLREEARASGLEFRDRLLARRAKTSPNG